MLLGLLHILIAFYGGRVNNIGFGEKTNSKQEGTYIQHTTTVGAKAR